MKTGVTKTKWMTAMWIATSLMGCQSKQAAGEGLPPAKGEGVAAPTVPVVASLMTAASAAPQGAEAGMSGTGTLYPNAQAELGPKVTGLLASVNVDEGDKVKKGQVVFRLDSSAGGLMVKQAESQVAAAKTNLRATQLEYERAKELHARGSLPAATFEQIQARHDAARDGVTSAEVGLSIAKRSLSDTVVTSPISGVVTARHKDPGETVTMMPVTVVVVVQDVSTLELRVRLPEASLKTLSVGTSLTVTLPAVGVALSVPVERINPAVDVATRTVEVIAKLDNADGKLKPGMLANVAIAEETQAAGFAGAGAAESGSAPAAGTPKGNSRAPSAGAKPKATKAAGAAP